MGLQGGGLCVSCWPALDTWLLKQASYRRTRIVSPPPWKAGLQNTALVATLERDTKGLSNPIQPSDENLITGVHLYAENCGICHGASDAKPSNPAQGFYIEAPQLAKDGVEEDPEAALFWTVKHGIRFTAMPSFTTTLQDEEIWKIAMFLKQMDKLPPAVDTEWKKVPSVAATPLPK